MKIFLKFLFIVFLNFFIIFPQQTFAFPIYAQQIYENPREANGRLVCANCHLAQKPIFLETPTSVLPNTFFEAIVKIPYNKTEKQLLANGEKGNLNIGAIMILPKGFKLAPQNELSNNLRLKTKGVYITPYSTQKDNILVVGPISGDNHNELVFPISVPDPNKEKTIFFAKYPIYVGGNRGRGQIYPTGEKTNNNVITALTSGKITSIKEINKNLEVSILTDNKTIIKQYLPKNSRLLINEGEQIFKDQNLIMNPNVGGFGQIESEIVLQDPKRIYGYILFSFLIFLTQSVFVLKKKQFEKVQLFEQNF